MGPETQGGRGGITRYSSPFKIDSDGVGGRYGGLILMERPEARGGVRGKINLWERDFDGTFSVSADPIRGMGGWHSFLCRFCLMCLIKQRKNHEQVHPGTG